MADLSELQSSQSVKIAGANPTSGVETFWVDVDASGNLKVVASSTPTPTDKLATGTISALNGAVSVATNGCSTVQVAITGTFVATLIFEGQEANSTDWLNIVGLIPSGGISGSIGSPSAWVVPVASFLQFRIRAALYTSGTATVSLNASQGIYAVNPINFNASALMATVVGPTADGAAVTTNPVQVSGKDGSGNTQTLATNTAGELVTVAKIDDGSGNVITSDTQIGLVTSRRGLNTSVVPIASGYYSTNISIRQTAATAANATVFAMRNAAASTMNVYIEGVSLIMTFDTATPITRALNRYHIERFSTATPTGGTAQTAAKFDSSDAASQVTDIRFLDTGLTTTGVVFDNPFATMGCPATDATTTHLVLPTISAAIKLAPGEGLCIRLAVAAVAGQGLTGKILWSES